MKTLAPSLSWVALALAIFAAAPARAELERFAVVVGNDTGQEGDPSLRYAETDASRVAAVLQEVGGVRPENLVLLRGQDAGTVRRTLIAVNDRLRASAGQTVLIVYYSGHADAGALHLGSTPFELPELLVAIQTSLQSCSKVGRARIFTPVRESSEESQINFVVVAVPASDRKLIGAPRDPPSHSLAWIDQTRLRRCSGLDRPC